MKKLLKISTTFIILFLSSCSPAFWNALETTAEIIIVADIITNDYTPGYYYYGGYYHRNPQGYRGEHRNHNNYNNYNRNQHKYQYRSR